MSSLLRTKSVQIGQDNTPTNNFTLYQPSVPDGTLHLGIGNSGSTTDVLTLDSTGVEITGTVTATSFSGDGSNLTGTTGKSIAMSIVFG